MKPTLSQIRTETEVFQRITAQSLSKMSGLVVEPGTPLLNGSATPACDVAGAVRVQCSSFSGTAALCFSYESIQAFYEAFSKVRVENKADYEDAAAELINIVYGRTRAELNNEHGFDLESSRSTALKKRDIQDLAKTGGLILPFSSEFGSFYLSLMLQYWRAA